MAEKILNTRIQLKYDTWENWSKTTEAGKGGNLVLKAGEVAITTIQTGDSIKQATPPTVMFKVGDGTSKFSGLPWASALAADVYAWAKKAAPDYNDLTNKPTIPTIGNGKITINQAGKEVGSFTVNQSSPTTIDLTDADTDTQYQLVLSGHTLKLQSRAKGGAWADVSDQSFTLPDNNTTYSFAEGTTNGAFTVTPSDGTAQSVKIHGLGSAAYTASTAYDAAGTAAGVQSALLGSDDSAAGSDTIKGANKAAAAASQAAANAQSIANGKYSKPTGGIPKTDLAAAVQTSLGKADSAIQAHQTIATGTANGTIAVAGKDVAVKGLAALAYKSSLVKGDVGLGNVENKALDSTVTANSGNYITSGAVKTAIDSAISGVTQFDVVKYDSFDKLPTTGKKGVIYIIAHTHSDGNDSYDEYIWNTALTTPAYEKIGNTDVNLDNYVNTLSGTTNSGVVTNISKSGNTISVTSKSLATSSPAASGNATSFIDTISQAADGKITATKKSIANATTSAAGLMNSADKIKLDGVATGATKVTDSTVSGWGYIKSYTDTNQKIKAKSGSTDVIFGANDVVEIAAGTNVTVTPDAANKKITIASTDTGVTSVEVTGTGNAVTAATVSGRKMTLTKGATFLTSHQDISGKQDKIKAGNHITIDSDGVTVNAAWPTASDSGYAGINKTGTVTSVSTTANNGLKVTNGTTAAVIDIDDSVVFILNGGSSTETI